MSKKISKADIDKICKDYYSVAGTLIQDIRSLDFGILVEKYLQQLTFILFLIPVFIKNGLILDSKNEKISLVNFIDVLKESDDVAKNLSLLFNIFSVISSTFNS